MNEVWNLDPIYTGFDDPAFEADLNTAKEKLAAFTAFTGTSAYKAAERTHIEVHIHHLLLDGPLICSGSIYLREESSVCALLGKSCPLNLHISHLD